MNSDQENFEALRKLLALKKYEQPPPRYFSELSTKIWTRIDREDQKPSFWARLFPNLRLNPAFAYSFGLLACGSLVFGIGYTLSTNPEQTAGSPIDNNLLVASPKLAIKEAPLNFSNTQATQLASTNPVMSPELPSLFNGIPLQVQPASYTPSQ
jgi:hypothetical protein